MEQVEIRVEGMTCGGCVSSIQNALNNREGITSVSVHLDSSTVTIAFDSTVIQQDAIEQTIIAAGFIVTD